MRPDAVPAPTVRRLSLYLRELEAMQEEGKATVSSKELGEALSLTDAQVRKDLACFGQFGQPGIGYQVSDLVGRVRGILGADRPRNVVLVGAGQLGTALTRHKGFGDKGFRLVAVFDGDAERIGRAAGPDLELVIRSMDELDSVVAEHKVRLGIICVPATSAQEVADRLTKAGVKGLMNFAPVTLKVPEGVAVTGVDLAVQLEQVSFQVGVE
jgi:redox-sensing transcriptional repressor